MASVLPPPQGMIATIVLLTITVWGVYLNAVDTYIPSNVGMINKFERIWKVAVMT
jgi:hypothetical protein